MVAPAKRRPVKSAAPWHAGFMNMLPVIRDYARGAFGHLKAELRQDLIQEVIANAMVAYVRLFEQGKVALAYPDRARQVSPSPRSAITAASAPS
jgi:hypothetical protein